MPKKRYTPEEILQHLRTVELETSKGLKNAREAKKGLRADPHPMPPWEWRKRRRPTIAPRVIEPDFITRNTFGINFYDSVIVFERGTIPLKMDCQTGKSNLTLINRLSRAITKPARSIRKQIKRLGGSTKLSQH